MYLPVPKIVAMGTWFFYGGIEVGNDFRHRAETHLKLTVCQANESIITTQNRDIEELSTPQDSMGNTLQADRGERPSVG